MITELDEYFTKGCGRCARFATADCATHFWRGGLLALRSICQGAGLVETLKWAHPCYMHSGRNIAILGAHRGDFRLSFFDAALMTDPHAVLERQGPNTQHADMLRFTDAAEVHARAPILRAYLSEAMGYAEAGIKPPKDTRAIELPDELVAAMEADSELAAAFHALTPGRQKSYVIHLSSAKTSKTRVARIERARGKILSGKGATER